MEPNLTLLQTNRAELFFLHITRDFKLCAARDFLSLYFDEVLNFLDLLTLALTLTACGFVTLVLLVVLYWEYFCIF